MNILSGQFKGHKIEMPPGIRPTQNIVRKSVFDVINPIIESSKFLDLFAGSGAMGLEATSRGAKEVILVEKEVQCTEFLNNNINKLKIRELVQEGSLYVCQMDAFKFIKEAASKKVTFDIIFIDPPYSRGLAKKALKTLGAYDILSPDSIVIIQHDKAEILPHQQGRILQFKQRYFGFTCLDYYQLKGKL